MGTALGSIAAIGALALWPSVYTFDYLDRVDALVAYRRAQAPVARAVTKYIAQDAAGDATGGGGAGTLADPYLCRHMADVRTLVAAVLTTNMAILFRQGDTFYAADANSAQGIAAAAFGSYSFGSYHDPASPSSEKPRLLGFKAPYGASGWAPSGLGGSVSRTDATTIYWTRARATIVADDVRAYRTNSHDKADSTATCDATAFTWIYTGGDLHANVSTDDIATLEAAVAQGAGITVGNVDNVRIDNLILEGWGLDDYDGGGQIIAFTGYGTNELYVSNCEVGWGPYHTMGQIVSGQSGGILIVDRCALGYFTVRSTAEGGGGDSCIAFVSGGGQELYLLECTWTGGALLRLNVAGAGTSPIGTPAYAHSSGGATQAIGLCLRWRCNVELPSYVRHRWESMTGAGDSVVNVDAEPPTMQITMNPVDPTDQRAYRFIAVEEVGAVDGNFGRTIMGIWINCTWYADRTSPAANVQIMSGLTTNTINAIPINTVLLLRAAGNWSGKYAFLFQNTAPGSPFSPVHCQIGAIDHGITVAPNNDWFSFESNANNTVHQRWFNTIAYQNEIAQGSTTCPLRLTNQSGAINKGGTITGISSADPAVVTSAAHGLATDDVIHVTGSNSGVTINGPRQVIVLTADTFSVAVNNSGAAGTAGQWVRIGKAAALHSGLQTGGMQRCAIHGFPTSQHNAAASRNVSLAAAPSWIPTWSTGETMRGLLPANIIGVGEPNLPGNRRLEYDITRARRPLKPTIGPLEANPVRDVVSRTGRSQLRVSTLP